MFQSILKFFKDQPPKQKPRPSYYSHFTHKDPETNRIQQRILKDDNKIKTEYEGWKRLKVKQYDRQQLLEYAGNSHFIDHEFPHNNSSISGEDEEIEFEWKRIPDFIKFCVYSSAQTYDNFERISLSSKKLKQALLFMYRTHPNKFKELLAQDCQPSGFYQYKLYFKGVIENVFIDDYVPVVRGNLPLMVGPVADREVFPMLIQKAIAKICGGYDRIPEDLDELLQIIFCGPLRKTKVDELNNSKLVSQVVEKSLGNKGVAAFISKNQPRLRNFGISQNQIYHIINRFNIDLLDKENIDLYELVSEKKLSSWTGKFSHNDIEWEKVKCQQRSDLLKHLQKNKSFFMSGNDIVRIFDHLITFDGTDINNKQWIELQSEVSFPSFATFQLLQEDDVFIRSTTQEPVRNSLILAKIEGKDNYKYIKGVFHENQYSVELTQKLKPGKYILCSHHDWILNKFGQYNLFLSSNTHALITHVSKGSFPNFLQILFKNYSQLCKKIEPTPDFLTVKKYYNLGMLAKQNGFAFVIFNLEGVNQKELTIQLNTKVLSHESWEILEPNADRKVIRLQKGIQDELILILKTHKYINKQSVAFPSTAFTVKT